MDLSILIINYNTLELTKNTINSILDTVKNVSYEIIVIDNSTSREEIYVSSDERIFVLGNVPNNGFAHACNLGFSHAKGKYVLYLNSDVILHQGTIDKSVEYMLANPRVGALGIRTLRQDGSLDHGCKRGFPTPSAAMAYYIGLDRIFPKSRRFGAYRHTFIDEMVTSRVDAVSGAFLMSPREVVEQIEGFDERFFMYAEDIDFCYKVNQAGYEVIYFADVTMTHLKGQSGLNTKSEEILYHFYHSMILFYKKNYQKKYSIFTTAFVYSGIYFKYFLSILSTKWKNRRKKK